jgi:type I restriction enzyme S subunit
MVELKNLTSVAEVQYGYPFESSLFSEDPSYVPLIRIRDVKPGVPSTYYSGEYPSEYIIRKGDILVGMDGEFNLARWKSRDGLLNQRVLKLSGKDDLCQSGYLFHYMGPVFKKIEQQTAGGSVKHLSAKVINSIQIPVPSLSEQNRIVNILDKFAASIENIHKQIKERRQQYAHYLDLLLDIDGKPEEDIHSWGEFCEMIKGNGVQKVDFVDEGFGCIHYGQIYTHYGSFTYTTNKFVSKETFDKAKKASKGDIVMTDTSENVEDICKSVAYLGEDDIAVSNHALIIKHHQNPKFLSYSTLTRSFFNQKRKVVVGVKVSGIKPEQLGQIKIYLPSLSEQNRIVNALDKFEAIIANLEEQIDLRQKQYEYYRNKLLTFD